MKINFLMILSMFFIASCYSNFQNPNNSIPAKEVSIRHLLSYPSVHDMQGVIVEGKVWDLEYVNLDYTVASFKLADEAGNYIDVISKDVLKFGKGDIIKVKGIFETNFDQKSESYEYYVHAKNIELIRND